MFVVLHMMKQLRLYFQGKNYIIMNLFCKKKLKVFMMRVNESECNKNNSSRWHNFFCFIINIF